jgi:senataxin
MTCVRLLEILPVLVDKLCLFGGKEHRNFTMLVKNKMGFKWIHNFMEWGKSSLKVVIVYWKRALSYLLNLFKGSCNKTSASTIMTIENLITSSEFFFFFLYLFSPMIEFYAVNMFCFCFALSI